MKGTQVFKKTKYDILVLGSDGKPKYKEVEGDVHTAGIFAARKIKGGWTLDHLPTGRSVMVFKTKKHAMRFITLAMAPDVLPLFVLSDKVPDRIRQIYSEAVA